MNGGAVDELALLESYLQGLNTFEDDSEELGVAMTGAMSVAPYEEGVEKLSLGEARV